MTSLASPWFPLANVTGTIRQNKARIAALGAHYFVAHGNGLSSLPEVSRSLGPTLTQSGILSDFRLLNPRAFDVDIRSATDRRVLKHIAIYIGGHCVCKFDGYSISLLAEMFKQPAGALPLFGLLLPPLAGHRRFVEIDMNDQVWQSQKAPLRKTLLGFLRTVLHRGPAALVLEYLKQTGEFELQFQQVFPETPTLGEDLSSFQPYHHTIAYDSTSAVLHDLMPGPARRVTVDLPTSVRYPVQVFYVVEDEAGVFVNDRVIKSAVVFGGGHKPKTWRTKNETLILDKARHNLAASPCHSITFATPDEVRRDRQLPVDLSRARTPWQLHVRVAAIPRSGYRLRIYTLFAQTITYGGGLGMIYPKANRRIVKFGGEALSRHSDARDLSMSD